MIQLIRRSRKLPAQGSILVNVGDRVQPGTAVGKLDYIPGQLYRFNVAEAIGVAPQHMPEALLKQAGDWVDEGEPLAATDEFHLPRSVPSPRTGYVGLVSRVLGNVFIREPLPAGPKEPVVVGAADIGMSLVRFTTNLNVMVGETVEKGRLLVSGGLGAKQSLLSPVFGKVAAISRSEGTITIKPLYQPTEVLAHVAGTVTEVIPGDSVEITVTGHLVQGMIGYGGEHVGELLAPAGDGGDLQPADLPEDVQGKVIIGRRGASREALKRCADGGAAGLILGSADYQILSEFIAADPLQVTGPSVDIPLTIVLINGFGSLPMAGDAYAELVGLTGRTASIDGSTQLRAGVVRPEVIVPIDIESAPEAPAAPDVLAVGMRVMIIREPGFGVAGRIKSLTSQPQPVRSGALATTAVIVAEDDGREWTAPQSNLKVLEGVAK